MRQDMVAGHIGGNRMLAWSAATKNRDDWRELVHSASNRQN